jgi:hypothetical protein
MKINIGTKAKRVLAIGTLSLAIVGVSAGIAFKSHPFVSAASSSSSQASDGETKDDSNKLATPNVQDNGQDGETKDSATQ